MSDQQEKTEEASPFKLEEARKKGMVPHSADLMSLALVSAFLMAIAATGSNLVQAIAVHTRWWLENAAMLAVNPGFMLGAAGKSLQVIAYAMLPVIAAMVIMAVLVNLLFSGFVFSTTPLKPDFKRLHPVQGLKKIFSRRMLIELGKLLLKAMLFAVVLYWIFDGLLQHLLAAPLMPAIHLPVLFEKLFIQLGSALLAIMLLAAIWDMWMSRREFARQMRMSNHEVKDEYKRREGDPDIKSKRKQAQQALIKKLGALGKVSDADVIITNPTHYAVALQYRPGRMTVPIVLASGQGMIAQQICRLARRYNIPVLQRPPLTRLLYRECGINHPIPVEAELDVAAVYRWVIAQPGNRVTT